MNYRSKYIILAAPAWSVPVVFGDLMDHSEMAAGRTVTGAGFCYINEMGEYAVYGRSVKLGIESKPEDAVILNKFLGLTEEEY